MTSSDPKMQPTPTPPKTLNDHLKNLAGAGAVVVFTLILIEVLLRLVDPWGLYYFQDLEYMGNVLFQPEPVRGFFIPDGSYTFTRWKADIQDGGRVIPATNRDADCTIAILGDSVAFGYGVNDDQTWVNQMARDMPDVHFINLGVPRYNSTNVVGSWKAFPDADAYLYLIILNDLEDAINVETDRFVGGGTGQPWLVRYTNFAIYRGGGNDLVDTILPETTDTPPLPEDQPGLDRLWREIETLRSDERVSFAAFERQPLTITLQGRGLPLSAWVYPVSRRISMADYHLNPIGNQELAAQALPVLRHIAQDRCSQSES